MNITLCSITHLILSTIWLTTLPAEKVSTRIVDGLGRPPLRRGRRDQME